MTGPIGVITADIVASRDLAPAHREALYADLKGYLQLLKKEKWVRSFELYRGDSLQCVATQTPQVLRVALLLKSFIRSCGSGGDGKYDVRIGIGVGGVDFYNQRDLAHSDGEAFRLSGEGLDGLKDAPWRTVLRTADVSLNASLEPAILLLDAVLQKWTAHQAEAIRYRLEELKEEAIAQRVGVSQPAINQRLRAGQWWAIDALLRYFEEVEGLRT